MRKTLPSDDASQRLDERTFIEGQRIGNAQGAELDVDLRHADILGEAAGVEVCRAQQVAHRLTSSRAIAAFAAGHMVRGENPITYFKVFDPFADFRHFAGDLVP